VARRSDRSFVEAANLYPFNDAVNVVSRGVVGVELASTAVPGDQKAAYVVLTAGADQGKFTDSSSGTYVTGAVFKSGRLDGDYALVEVRGSN